MFSEISLPVPSHRMMMLRMGDSRERGACYLGEYSEIWFEYSSAKHVGQSARCQLIEILQQREDRGQSALHEEL